jgi:hypothetical protein
MKHHMRRLGILASFAFLATSLFIQTIPIAQASHTLIYECEGNACGEVTFTWDAVKEQYKVENHSADRWVQVNAANLVAAASLCLGPSKSDYLALSTVVGTFRANLAAENCGTRT